MKFFTSMLQDGVDGSVSSKRVITALAFLLCAYGFVASIHGYEVKTELFDSMIYLVIAGLGFTASEKFAKKDKPNE
jgi:UDP-N-acetylmuramyl pentapeptide phosphotransferase/UDP-N-acetylglucosamine-1-phosphate transferase